MANIREFASWCHQSDPEAATERAKDSVRMAVAKVRLMQPLQTIEVPVTNKALIIGGGIAGMNAALDLAEHGLQSLHARKHPEHRRTHGCARQNLPHPGLQHLH